MLAYTLKGGKLEEGIQIPGDSTTGRLLLVKEKGGSAQLVLMSSPAGPRFRYRNVRYQSMPVSKKCKVRTLILSECEEKDDKALLLVDYNRDKLEYKLIPQTNFEELTSTGLLSEKGDLLAHCSPGANLVIKDPKTGTVTRYVWNGTAFKPDQPDTSDPPATPP